MKIAEYQIGHTLPSVQLPPVSRMDLIKYSGASGDFNPIHTIDAEAEKAGLPGIIAHGMWTMGNLSKLFTSYHEEGFIKTFTIRFSGMVFLEDVITLKAELKEKVNESSLFSVTAENGQGQAVIKGNVSFHLYQD
ncbi:acyl dehydratase [Scopulibacillus darangshiensis]|uniref:Acyl dehydratase n=1 Tax=Scopulibacillus darangshiensis TaxID=442528 RepID=A0A4R2P8X5_9BACL|nr:MaoC/PaaZ C-terminal domain-containing protein [Scopulibacillus darangshiensis]TCP31327.1 acyl dehydratase [Scopulibacillus darangshiensis]